MQIKLEVTQGPHQGRSFTFDGHDNFIVGRARCAHFRLPKEDPYFSRVHFMIEVNPPHCRLVDMGSTNGTRVNDRRVQATDLRHGDLIQGGETVLRVSFVPAPDAEPSQPSDTPTAAAFPREPPAGGLESTESYDPRQGEGAGGPGGAVAQQPGRLPEIKGYQIHRKLGQGGMGVVYLATRCSDELEVALKMIRPAISASERQVRQFLREADVLRQLRHPHIVAFHEMGRAGELLYFVMDYVAGSDASALLQEHGPLRIPHAVGLICQVLEALHYAHGQGFVHRDVKPANLLLSGEVPHELCKLADFGLARVYHASPLSGLTILGDVGGTITYMPPEQITDYRHASPAADQYATAATLYRLLTGHYLFDFEGVPKEQQFTKTLLDQPILIQDRRPDMPDPLCQAVHRALEKEPAARFPDAVALRDALLPFAGDE